MDVVCIDEIEGVTNTFGRECASASFPAAASTVVLFVRLSEEVKSSFSLKTIGTELADVDSWASQSGRLGSEVLVACLLDTELRDTSIRGFRDRG